jgi:hypothetical protein
VITTLLCNVIRFDRWRLAVAVAALLLLALLRAPLTRVPDALFVSDGFGYYLYLPSLIIDRDLDFTNQLSRLPYEGEKHFFRVSDRTGRRTNQFPIGCAILWAPLFVLADGVVQAASSVGMIIPRTGFGWAYELPVYTGSFLYGLAGIWLIQRTLRLIFDRTAADLSLFTVLFATPTAYYPWFEPNMSHAVALFTVALWVYLLLWIYRTENRRIAVWAVLGAVLGLVGLVRPYNAVLGVAAIPVALAVCQGRGQWNFRAFGGAILRLSVCCLASLLTMLPQVIVWQLLYGQPSVVPRGSGYEAMSWLNPAIAAFAASWYVFCPAYIPATLGLFLAWPSRPKAPAAAAAERNEDPASPRDPARFAALVAPFFLLVLAVIAYLIAASRDWMLGTAFGQRRMVDWSPLFAIGLGLLFQRFPALQSSRLVGLAVALLALATTLLIPASLVGLLPQYGRVL